MNRHDRRKAEAQARRLPPTAGPEQEAQQRLSPDQQAYLMKMNRLSQILGRYKQRYEIAKEALGLVMELEKLPNNGIETDEERAEVRQFRDDMNEVIQNSLVMRMEVLNEIIVLDDVQESKRLQAESGIVTPTTAEVLAAEATRGA